MGWFRQRFNEPSSFAALGGFFAFLGVVLKDDNLPVIADSVTQNADTLANGDYITAGMNIAATIAFALGFSKKEGK